MAASPTNRHINALWHCAWWDVVWDASTIRYLIADLIIRLAKKDSRCKISDQHDFMYGFDTFITKYSALLLAARITTHLQ
jgi:hypothetical protein